MANQMGNEVVEAKKTCGKCEFFNPEGSYLFTTQRQNGKIYGQHVVKGSTCHVDKIEVSRKEGDFICRCFQSFTQQPDKELVDFVEYVDEHLINTCNAGHVLVNTDCNTLKRKAQELLAKYGD